MSIWSSIFDWLSLGDSYADLETSSTVFQDVTADSVNPATGLPMLSEGCGGIDVGGSPYGCDIHAHSEESWTSTSTGIEDDHWG